MDYSSEVSYSRNKYGSIFFCAVLSALSVICTAKGITVLSTTITLIYAFWVGTRNNEEFLPLLALAIPNTRSLEAFGVSGVVLACAIFVIIRLLVQHKIETKIFGLGMTYLIYSLQFFFRFEDVKIAIVMPLKMVIVLWCFMIIASELSSTYFTSRYYIFINNSMLIGIIAAVFASLVSTGGGSRLSVVENDPNMLAAECAFILSVYCVAYFKKGLSTIQFLVGVIISVFIGLMCGSRMGILLIAVVIIISIVLNLKSVNRTTALLLIVTVAALIFVFSNAGQRTIMALQRRNNVLLAQDNFSNGRFELWKEYIAVLNSSCFLWFFGMGSYVYYGISSMAHNFLIEDIASYGIIGTFIIYIAYLVIFKTVSDKGVVKLYKQDIYTILPFFVPLFGGLTLHGMSSTPNLFMLFAGILIYKSI